jgi:NAD(P)-dependent dehydrogenase (short-subunit alcohol dehydrogenase family)
MAELAGKVAVVTGGASGIGRATAERFVAEGAQVVIGDVDAEGAEAVVAELGDAAAFQPTDVSDAGQVQALVDTAVERFGGLHVMFNNAGIGAPMTRFLHDDLSGFQREIDINLFGTFVGSQRAARHMKEHGGGVIINNSSLAGIEAGPGLVTYRAVKAAVIHSASASPPISAPTGSGSTASPPVTSSPPSPPTTSTPSPATPSPSSARARPRRRPTPWSSWPATRRPTSPGRSCRSTAGRPRGCRSTTPS